MNRLYAWYDKLEEPYRFLLFLLLVPVLGIMPLYLGNDIVRGIAAGYLMLLLITRMIYRSKRQLAKARSSKQK